VADRVDGLILTREEACGAAIFMRVGIDQLARRNGTVSPAAVLLAGQLERFGRETPDMQASAPAEKTNPGPGPDRAGSAAISVTAAAGLLSVSAQRIRGWCRSGDLIAWRDAPGTPWKIDELSAAALAARRSAGE
jgi:hypothetical protein